MAENNPGVIRQYFGYNWRKWNGTTGACTWVQEGQMQKKKAKSKSLTRNTTWIHLYSRKTEKIYYMNSSIFRLYKKKGENDIIFFLAEIITVPYNTPLVYLWKCIGKCDRITTALLTIETFLRPSCGNFAGTLQELCRNFAGTLQDFDVGTVDFKHMDMQVSRKYTNFYGAECSEVFF